MTAAAEERLGHLPQHLAVLRRALARLEPDDRVEGVALSGSLAHGAPDVWSDIDLYVVACEPRFAEVFAERAASAAAIGAPLAQFTVGGFGGGSSDQIVLYDNLVKLDLMFYRPSELVPHVKWENALLLKDVRGVLVDMQARSSGLTATTPSDDRLLELDQQFWLWCWYALGKINRGEAWAGLDALHEIRSVAVIPLLLAIAEQHDEGYRRLESKLATSDSLRSTVAGLDLAAQRAALQQELEVFVSARGRLFPDRGLVMNVAAETALRAAVR